MTRPAHLLGHGDFAVPVDLTASAFLEPHAPFAVPLADEHLGDVRAGVPVFDYDCMEAQR